jgi:chromosome segregation ATPase
VDIGTELSTPCRLTVGVDDHIEAEVEGLQNAIKRREERLSKMEEKIASMEAEEHKIHKEIADMAQVQDRSLVNQRSLKEKLADLPDDDTEDRPKLETAITDLGRQAQEAEEALGGLFDRQDEVANQTEKTQNEIEQVKEDIYELKHELDAIRHWSKSQKKAATVKVSGTIFQGTIIGGPHTRTVVKENARHTTIREVKNTDPDSSVEYEIKLQHS